MKVLVIEDDPDQLAIRGLLLERFGFETILVSDSASAVRAAVAECPDCALLDLRLPSEADGLALIRALNQLPGKLPIFVLTGGDPRRFDRRPERTLVREVIRKGSSSSDLIERLRTMQVASGNRPV